MAIPIFIDDPADPRLAIYRDLKRTNETRSSGQFVLEGEKLLDALLGSRFRPASALVLESQGERIAAKIPDSCPCFVLSRAALSEVVGYRFHQGVVCSAWRADPPRLEALLAERPASTLVVCPKLDNPDNLGAILRIGDAFGIDAVVIGSHAPDPFSRRVLRVSMGSALRVAAVASDDLARDWDRLRDHWGFEFLAAVTDPGAIPIEAIARPERLALVLGCESRGLDAEWLGRCQRRVTIPMRPGADSLNVAVAAGILLCRLTRC